MSAMQLFGIKANFCRLVIFSQHRDWQCAHLTTYAPLTSTFFFLKPPRPHCHQRSKVGWYLDRSSCIIPLLHSAHWYIKNQYIFPRSRSNSPPSFSHARILREGLGSEVDRGRG